MGKFKGNNFRGTNKKQNHDQNESEGRICKDRLTKTFKDKKVGNLFIKEIERDQPKTLECPKSNGSTNSTEETKFSEGEKLENTKKHHINNDSEADKVKIPFDKKKYRLKKYSNKYKVEKWQSMREKKILTQYQKITKKPDNKGLDVQKIYERYENENSDLDESNPVDLLEHKRTILNGNYVQNPKENNAPRKQAPLSIKEKQQEIEKEKEKKKQEFLKKKAEKEEALKLSRKMKAERYKKLNKRTKKGQPIMKDRMEMIFEQVQKMCQE